MAEPVQFPCPGCGAGLRAPADRVGDSARCPRCGQGVVVADLPVEPRATTVEPTVEPIRGSRRTYGPFIPVVCRVCGTRMYATPEQQGRSLGCPDCRAKTPVPTLADLPLSAAPPVAVAGAEETGYELADETSGDGSSGGGVPPREALVAVVCEVCRTRMYARLDEVGGTIECPDCGRRNVVPPPPRERKRHGPAALSADAPRPPGQLAPPEVGGTTDGQYTDAQYVVQYDVELPPLPPPPPKWTFFSGVWTFPFYREVWPRWLALTVAAWPLLVLVDITLAAVGQVGASFSSVLAAPLTAMLAILSVVYFGVVGAITMAIMESTTDGNDRVDGWPEWSPVEWMAPAGQVGLALAISAAPGGAATQSVVGAAVSAAVLFPFVLLSILERETPGVPFSLAVWRSLRGARGNWIAFQLLACGLIAAAAIVGTEAPKLSGMTGMAVVSVPCAIAATLVYFRLLGRLAWVLETKGPAGRGRESGEG